MDKEESEKAEGAEEMNGAGRLPAAASILAKVGRDACLRQLDELYPHYGLARHKGYPTVEHIRALELYGPTPLHRTTFTPVRQLSLALGRETAAGA